MWGIQNVGCLGKWMFGMWDIWGVERLGCKILGMWHNGDEVC